MHMESVETPSLLELRATVMQRLQVYGVFDGCTAEDRRTILAQACLVIWHLTAGAQGRRMYLLHVEPPADRARHQAVLDTMTRLCPDVIAAVQGYIAAWRAHLEEAHALDPSLREAANDLAELRAVQGDAREAHRLYGVAGLDAASPEMADRRRKLDSVTSTAWPPTSPATCTSHRPVTAGSGK